MTGIVLILFVIGHVGGNLTIHQGQPALNNYAHYMQTNPMLWVVRLTMLAIVSLHIALGIVVTWKNRMARPESYHTGYPWYLRLYQSRMIVSGLVLLAFVVGHVAHLTLGAGVGVPLVAYVGNLRDAPLPDFLEIDEADYDLAPGTAKIVMYGPIPALLLQTPEPDSELRVFDATCTHFDCTVSYAPGNLDPTTNFVNLNGVFVAAVQDNTLVQIDLDGDGAWDAVDTDGDGLVNAAPLPNNTYRIDALPPTPIAAPGLASLQAAAAPADTGYFFYVLADEDGNHAFAATYDEFLVLVEQSRERGLIP